MSTTSSPPMSPLPSPIGGSKQSPLRIFFGCCERDPKGAVHKAWGIALVFMAVLFVVSCFVVVSIQTSVSGGSNALSFAALWTGLVQIVMAVLGTFVLKRFPTSFSVGFFLGLVVVVAQQNLIMCATFLDIDAVNSDGTSHLFSMLCLTLSFIHFVFALVLGHFRHHILLAPVDVKGVVSRDQVGGGGGAQDEDLTPYYAHDGEGDEDIVSRQV